MHYFVWGRRHKLSCAHAAAGWTRLKAKRIRNPRRGEGKGLVRADTTSNEGMNGPEEAEAAT